MPKVIQSNKIMTEQKQCPQCRKEIDILAKKCPYCQSKISYETKKCQNCNKSVPIIVTQCPYCNSSFAGEKTKQCPKCRASIYAHAIFCPHCKSDTRSFGSRHPIFIGIIVLFISTAILGGGGGSNTSTNVAAPEPQKSQKEMALEACLILAGKNYSDNWDKACKDQGKAADCKLVSVQATVIDNRHTSDKNDCYHAFPQ